MMEPFPVYITHAKGAHKWDVDGHKFTDYFVGHGSHILGHSPDDVVRAVQEQMAHAPTPAPATTSRSNGASSSRN